MELRQLETFRAVARELSFTRAAAQLEYAQSSVTTQVQTLERELGVALFERLGRRVVLTERGRRLLGYSERILNLAEEVREAVSGGGEPSGTLDIGAPETLATYRLPPALRTFRELYPRVRLVFHPAGVCAHLHRSLADGSLDVAFLLSEPVRPPGLVVEELLPEPLLVVAPPDHPLAGRERVAPRDLDGEPVLLTEAGCSYRVLFDRVLADAGARLEETLEFASVEAIKQCVMAGMGIAILPEVSVAAEVADGGLAALRWAGPAVRVSTRVALHKDKHLSPALGALLEVVREALRPPAESLASRAS